MSRGTATLRSVLDQAVIAKVRAGRLRSGGWPYGLRAVAAVGVGLFVLAGALALAADQIRQRSTLVVPNSLINSVPEDVVWLLLLLLAFSLALFSTAAIHGPRWMNVLGVLSLALPLGAWSAPTTVNRGVTLALVAGVVAVVVVLVLTLVRRRRSLAWWEFPLILGLIGLVVTLASLDHAQTDRLLGFRIVPLFLDETFFLLTYLVLPAAFAAGAAIAEIVVGLTLVATRSAQRGATRRWPYVVLGALVAVRLAQEATRVSDLDPVRDGWLVLLPAVGLVAGWAGLGWLVARLCPLDGVSVEALPDHLSRMAVPVGAGAVAVMLPVYVVVFGYQIVKSLVPGAPGILDPSPLVDRLIYGLRMVLGGVLVALSLWQARRGRAGLALVLGCVGLVLVFLSARLVIGYRWAVRVDSDAVITVVTALALAVAGWLLARRRLSRDRALGLAAVLVLATLLSARGVLSDPFDALLGYSGVAFVLFGLVWDFLTGSDWANTDGRRIRRPVRALLAVGYPLLTVTVLAGDALIRRVRTASDLTAMAELGELVLGTGLLAAAAVVLLSAVRANRPVG